jgi:hypothetical protein
LEAKLRDALKIIIFGAEEPFKNAPPSHGSTQRRDFGPTRPTYQSIIIALEAIRQTAIHALQADNPETAESSEVEHDALD